MWGRGGEGHEEEEPAKKQKWLEWWQVLWAGVESQRQGKREVMKEDLATSSKYLREARRMVGRKELNQVIFI